MRFAAMVSLLLCVMGLCALSMPRALAAEGVLGAVEGRPETPLRPVPSLPQYQIRNARLGMYETRAGRIEVPCTFDFVRNKRADSMSGDIMICMRSSQGMSYVKVGTTLFRGQASTIKFRFSGVDPSQQTEEYYRKMPSYVPLEFWLAYSMDGNLGGPFVKASESVILGPGHSPTLPREWTAEEGKMISAWLVGDRPTAKREIKTATSPVEPQRASSSNRPTSSRQFSIALPDYAEPVTRETPLPVGAMLWKPWGHTWHVVSVLELKGADDVHIGWKDWGPQWNETVRRDELIIDQRVAALLRARAKLAASGPRSPSAAPAMASASSARPTADSSAPAIMSGDAEKPSSASPAEPSSPANCELVLKSFHKDRKFDVWKVVMDVTELELPEAKELTVKLPATIRSNLTRTEADEWKKKFKAAGGVIEVKEPKSAGGDR